MAFNGVEYHQKGLLQCLSGFEIEYEVDELWITAANYGNGDSSIVVCFSLFIFQLD